MTDISSLSSSSPSNTPVLLAARSSTVFIVSTLSLAMFTDGFVYGVIIPILPFSLPLRANVPQPDVQYWASALISAFGLAKLLGSPALGWLADRTASRRSFLLAGLLLQGAATLMLGLGRNVAVLMASRLMQGLSAAVIYTGGFALLVETVDGAAIGKWMGVIMAAENVGIFIAPTVGGVLYGQLGWNAVFALMVAIVGVDILLRLAMIEKTTAARWRVVVQDGGGPFVTPPPVITIASDGDMPVVDETRPLLSPSKDSATIPPVSEAEPPTRRRRTPTLLLFLLSPRILSSLFGVITAQAHVTALDSVLPRFLSLTFSFTPTSIGLIFIIWASPTVFSSFGGYLSDRYGPRWIATFGFSLAATALALLPLVTRNTAGQIALACVLLNMDGTAFSLLHPPLASDMAAVVAEMTRERPELASPAGDYGQVFSLLSCGVAAGTTVGPLLGGWLYRTYGWGVMGWTLAGLLLLAAALVAMFTGGKRAQSDRDSKMSNQPYHE